MKIMICIPVDVDVDTTSRMDIRNAAREALAGGLYNEMAAALDAGTFVVRAPERPKVAKEV